MAIIFFLSNGCQITLLIFCCVDYHLIGSLEAPCYSGHGGIVATHLNPTSEVGSSNTKPYVGKMVVSY